MTCKPGIPSSHSCDLSDNHGDAHHCPACGRAWVLSGTCRAAETTPGPSAVQSPQTAPRDGSAEATGPLAAHLPAIRDALSIAISEAQYAATEKPYREAQDALDGLEAEVRAKRDAEVAAAAGKAVAAERARIRRGVLARELILQHPEDGDRVAVLTLDLEKIIGADDGSDG